MLLGNLPEQHMKGKNVVDDVDDLTLQQLVSKENKKKKMKVADKQVCKKQNKKTQSLQSRNEIEEVNEESEVVSKKPRKTLKDLKRKSIIDGNEKETNVVSKKQRKVEVRNNRTDSVYYHFTGMRISLRCSPTNLYSFLKKLTKEQKKVVCSMGFGEMLGLSLHTIPTAFGYWLLKNFDPTTDILNDSTHEIKVTSSMIHEVFGIPHGPLKVHTRIRPNAYDPVVNEWRNQFGEEVPKKVYINQFAEYLEGRKDSGRIFKLNFLVLLFTVIAESMMSNTVNQRFLASVTTKTDVKQLNWCQYILDCLREKRKAWKQTEEDLFNGPLLILSVSLFKF